MKKNYLFKKEKLHFLLKGVVLCFILSLVSFQAKAADFDWSEVIQKGDIKVSYDKNTRKITVKFPYVINQGVWDWMYQAEYYISWDGKSQQIGWLKFPKRNGGTKLIDMYPLPAFYVDLMSSSNRPYLTGGSYLTSTAQGSQTKTVGNRNAMFMTQVFELPANLDCFGKEITLSFRVKWAPDDYRTKKKGPIVPGGSENNSTGSDGVLSTIYFNFSLNIDPILSTPVINSITVKNDYKLELNLSNVEGDANYLYFAMKADNSIAGSGKLATNAAGTKTDYIKLTKKGTKITAEIDLKAWISKYNTNYSILYLNPHKTKGVSERLQFLLSLLMESDFEFWVNSQKTIGAYTHSKTSDRVAWKPQLAQAYYLTNSLALSDKQIILNWQVPSISRLNGSNPSIGYSVQRSNDGGKTYKEIARKGFTDRKETKNNIHYYEYIDTDSELKEGNTYYYRIVRQNTSTIGWDNVHAKNSIKIDYSKYKRSLDIDTTTGKLQWSIPDTSINKMFTKAIIKRRVAGEENFVTKATKNKAELAITGGIYSWLDNDVEHCKEYEYKVELVYGNLSFETNTVSYTIGENKEMLITNFRVSKGTYSDRIEVSFNSQHWAPSIQRRVKGSSSDWQTVYTRSGETGNDNKVIWSDVNVSPGQYYEYRGYYDAGCSDEWDAPTINMYTPPVTGFKRSSATVTGRITYSGGTAVQGVKVMAKSTNETLLGRGYGLKTHAAVSSPAKVVTSKNEFNTFQDFAFQSWVYCPDNNNQEVKIARKQTGSTVTFNTTFKINDTLPIINVKINNKTFEFKGIRRIATVEGGNTYWYHVSIVRENDSIKAYLDGEFIAGQLHGIVTPSIAILNADTILYFLENEGMIDDARFWRRALTTQDVQNTYCRFISGDENGLAGYWKFDEFGIEDEFYDYSITDNIPNQRHGVIVDPNSYERSGTLPSENQLSLSAITNEYGNYVISGIPYLREGSLYRIIPMMGNHVFDPGEEVLFIDPSAYVHNKINFTDISSFIVRGATYYENTYLPVEDAMIYVDGSVALKNGEIITTDMDGNFEVSVPIGQHYIEVKKSGHGFVDGGRFPASGTYLFNQPLNIETPFYDTTKVRVIGRVAGGTREGGKDLGFNLSTNNVGTSYITLQARYKETYSLGTVRNDTIQHEKLGVGGTKYNTIVRWGEQATNGDYQITIYPDPETGEFFADLFPENFNVTQVQAGTDDNNQPYYLPTIQLQPIELKEKAGNKEFITMALEDSVEVADELGNVSKVAKQDSVSYGGVAKKYIRRNTPTLTVKNIADNVVHEDLFGEEDIIITNENKSTVIPFIDRNGYSYTMNGMPVFKMNNEYKMEIAVAEQYKHSISGEIDDVPVTDGYLEISNNFSKDNRMVTPFDTAGKIVYTFYGGNPSLSVNDLNDPTTYTQTMNIVAYTGENCAIVTNWKPENNPLRGYLLGAAVTGSNFTTKGPKSILTVLRDPPGSNSSASYENTTVFTTENTYEKIHGVEASLTVDFVVGTKISTGFGVYVESVDNENTVGGNVTTTHNWKTGNKSAYQTTLSTKYNTSEESNWVGAMADLIIGYSENYVYSEATTLSVYKDDMTISGIIDDTKINLGNGYYLAQRQAIDLSPEFETHFMYTVSGIENKIIPDLEKLRNALIEPMGTLAPTTNTKAVYISNVPNDDESFGTSGSYTHYPPRNAEFGDYVDEVGGFNKDIAGWKDVLAENEKDKHLSYMGGKVTNISFESGSSYESSIQLDTTNTYEKTYEYTVDGELHTHLLFKLGGVGMRVEAVAKEHSQFTDGSSTSDQKTYNYSYKLADSDQGDFYTIDTYSSSNGWGPIFRTRGGQTSCPYEDATIAKYYEPERKHVLSVATAQIERPRITIEPATRSNVPGNKAAIFDIILENESDTKDGVFFVIKVDESTNPHGAILAIDGAPIGNGRRIFVPAGTKTYKTLSLARTREDIYEYHNIKIEMQSECQCDPSANDYWPDIKSVATISANFVPSCGDITLVRPATTIVNQYQMDTTKPGYKGMLPINITKYDLNNPILKEIGIYYKTASDEIWKLLASYAKVPEGEQKKLEDPTITHLWDMNALSDNTYQIKAVAVGTVDNASSETEIIEIIKDTQAPVAFGKPRPANGILTAEDDISITFNEKVDGTRIKTGQVYGDGENPNHISVRGALHGYKVSHEAGLSFDGYSSYLTVPDKVNLNENFTIDFWIKRDRMNIKETILSHGEGTQLLEFGFTATNKLFVKIADTYIESNKAITAAEIQDDWSHVGIALQGNKVSVYANSDDYITSSNLPDIYNQMAVLTIGKSINNSEYFNGKLHGLRIWNKYIDVVDNTAFKNISLSGKENNLYACWDINEMTGTVITDKVRGRSAIFSASWFVEPIGKGLAFNGNTQYTTLPVKPLTSEQNYTIEFWFKANSSQTLPATIVATGKGETSNKFNIFFNENRKLSYRSGNVTTVISSENYLDNQWHHLAVGVNRSGNITFIVDGAIKNYASPSATREVGGRNFILGACEENSQVTSYFNGVIDEFRYWQMNRGEELIKLYRNNRLLGNEAGLLAYYPFDSVGLNKIINSTLKNMVTDTVLSKQAGTVINGAAFVEGAAIKSDAVMENVPFTWVLSNDKIIINLSEREDYIERMENNILTISTKSIYDMYGNPSEPIAWTVYVDRNQLKWSESELDFVIKQDDELTFEVLASNMSGTIQNFTLNNIPSWLTASVTSGTIQPRSTTKIVFTLDNNLPIGTYEQQVYLKGEILSDALKIKIRIAAEKPNWNVDPSEYASSMSIIGQLKIEDYYSTDNEDLLAAFSKGKCVGLTSPRYIKEFDAYYIFMDVYGNEESGSALTFKVWDAGTGRIYPEIKTSQDITYIPEHLYGDMTTPVLFETQNDITEQNILLKKGWNWVSFNVTSSSFDDLDKTFESISQNASEVKGTTSFSRFYNDNWAGSLDQIEEEKMYKFYMNNSDELKIKGVVVDLPSTPINLKKGWNWISFLPQQSMNVNDALANLTATDGDMIKGQNSFSVYSSRNGWVGTLEYLQPGKGYLYRAANATSFTYLNRIGIQRSLFNLFASPLAFTQYKWSFDENNYQTNMTMIALLYDGGVLCSGTQYEVGAFDKNGVCRGREVLKYSNGNYYLYLTIMGDVSGEELNLKVYDSEKDKEEAIIEKITFVPERSLGTHEAPMSLNFGTVSLNVNIEEESITLRPGDTYTPTAVVTPANATDKSLTWTSRNNNVAEVDQAGNITALNNGSTYIIAVTSDGKSTDSCKVEVNSSAIAVTGITVSPKKMTLELGEAESVTVNVNPANADNKKVTWISRDSEVATVNNNGVVTSLRAGTTYIVAISTDGGFKDSCQVKVEVGHVPVTAVSVTPKSVDLNIGQTQKLSATVTPLNASNPSITWLSRNNSIAMVSSEGVVMAMTEGTTYIVALSQEGIKDSCKVTVTTLPISVTGVLVTPKLLNMQVNESQNLTVSVLPLNAENKSVGWSCSNENIAMVNTSGKVVALSEGIAYIIVKTQDGQFKDSCLVNITPAPIAITGISVSPRTLSIEVGNTDNMTATVYPANADDKTVKWSSSNESIAIVSSDGKIIALSGGNVYIKAVTRDGNFQDSCLLTVTTPAVLVTNVLITPKTLHLEAGNSETLSVTVLPENAENKNVTWLSRNENIAKVNSNGEVTAMAHGSTYVVVSSVDGNLKDSCLVTVTGSSDVKITGITVSPKALNMTVGDFDQVTFTVTPVEADITGITWSSSNEAIAMISANGRVIAVSEGEAYVRAVTADGTVKDSCQVFVAKPAVAVSGILLAPRNMNITVGETSEITFAVLPVNANNTTITWTYDEEVVMVSNTGSVLGLKEGQTSVVISTQDGLFKDSCRVTVSKVTTGIEGVSENEKFSVYPNPTSGDITIESADQTLGVVEIYTPEGQKIFSRNYADETKATISLHHYSSGMYMIKVNGLTTKIVKF